MAIGDLGNLIFISYRRADSAAHTLALRLELETRLTAAQVFVDTRTIQGGDEWARQIEDALRMATVILPVVGKQWTGSDGASGTRRIDDPADWVHQEISGALASKRDRIVPLLIDGTPPLRRADLPVGIQDLADIQPLSLDLQRWDSDVETVLNLLRSKFSFRSKRKDFRYPTPDPLIAKTIPVPWEVLENEAAARLPDWRVEFSDDPDNLHYKRVHFVRDFEFHSFDEAVGFMQAATNHAVEVDHHPTLVNLWRTVSVSLSTWDAGHRITALDLQFAKYLERVYAKA